MKGLEKNLQDKWWLLWLVASIIVVIYLGSLFHFRLDLTKEKRFSLSNSTKEVLRNLDETVSIDVYLTGDLSAGFKKLSIASNELLQEFKEYGKGNLSVRFIKPGDGLPDSLRYMVYDSLVQMGIKPFNNQVTAKAGEETTERLIFPAAMITYKDRQIPVDLMSGKSGLDEESTLNYSEALLEFKFADAISKLTREKIPVVAYAVGNGEPLNPSIRDLFETMRNNYRFGILDLRFNELNADTIQTLLIVKPSQPFSETVKLKIDQFVMNGGNVIWFVDKLYAEMDSLQRKESDFVAYDKNLEIDDLLFKYGVRINGDLLQDLKCAKIPLVTNYLGGQPQVTRVPFPYYPLLNSPSNHPISKNMDDVLSVFPGSLDTIKAEGITKTILLASDTNSRALSSPALVSLNSIKTEDDIRTFNKSYVPVAILLEGKFTSLFANRFTTDLKDSLEKYSPFAFLPKGKKESKQIVVSDGDLVTNAVSQSQSQSEGPMPMGTLQFDNYQFANKEFLLNAVDYLVNPNGILETRTKDFTLRLLNKQKVAAEKTFWQLINIGLPILMVLIFGWWFQWRRKKKYSH